MKKLIVFTLGATLALSPIGCSSPKDSAINNNTRTNTKLASNNTSSNSQTSQALVASGINFDTNLQQELTTGKNRNNDSFVLKVRSNNPILKDSKIEGHIENVTKAAKGKKAKMNLVFDEIVLKNGNKLPINASLVNTQIESKTKGKFLQNVGIILGGTVAGKFVGNKANFKHGGTAGAAAATAYVLSSPGGEVVLKRGTNVKLKLNTPLRSS
ncbi:MAG: hypothetical protein KME64_22695 [Scytonematopsis contorta HA4267-MV1]|jgi:hypothetical protein|nr:hypothetical protein [Scytonematopsis contorta HA4267-MV1]